MRVGIIAIQHESNTFIPKMTEFQDFEEGIFVQGDGVREKYAGAHNEISGFLEGLDQEGISAVPLLATFAHPAGIVSDDALDRIWQADTEELKKAGRLDGILAAPHGAAVNQSRPDMDGWWLQELRSCVGTNFPVIAVIDPHANLSESMVASCNAVISYRENPHVDQRQRGREAADLMARVLRKEVKPVSEAAFPPLVINIESHSTSEEPMLSLIRELQRVRETKGVISASFVMGYPYADVPEMGSAFVVVTDDDVELAGILVQQLSAWLVSRKGDFMGQLISPQQAMRDASERQKPVGLLDMGDNVGAGAPADSTALAHRVCQFPQPLKTFVCLYDPECVQECETHGVGAVTHLEMGGKSPLSPAPPLSAEARIVSLHAGHFREDQPRHGGFVEFDMGATAVVETGGLTVMLTSRPTLPVSANQLYSCGLDPSVFDVLIIKGIHGPVAAYRDICGSLIRTNTCGITTADIRLLSYVRRRRPLFPFESE